MGWNGSGVVVRQTPVASGIVAWADTKQAGDVSITTVDHDYHDQDLAAAVTNTIAKDGQNTPTANLPMGDFRHTGAGDAVNNQDYATLIQLIGTSPVTGDTRNASMQISAASLLGTFTADQVIVSTILAGRTWRLANYSVSFNLGVTGAGGMDTGAAPTSGFVALYVIYNPTSATASILGQDVSTIMASTRYSGVNMPSGYTASALLSVWPTNSSHRLVAGAQVNRTLRLAPIVVLNSSSTQHASPATLSISGAVPKNAVFCDVSVRIGSTATADLAAGLYSNSFASPTSSIISGTLFSYDYTGLMITTPQQILYTATVDSGTMSLTINITGYSF